jgi:hypothetical protein
MICGQPEGLIGPTRRPLSAEAEIRRSLEETLGATPLAPATIHIDGKAPVKVDGVSDDETVFVEIFAHQGPLKGGQRHKVATDALKLITIGREHPDAQLVIALADETAAASLKSNTWLAAALRLWKVDVVVVPIKDDTRAQLRNARVRSRAWGRRCARRSAGRCWSVSGGVGSQRFAHEPFRLLDADTLA